MRALRRLLFLAILLAAAAGAGMYWFATTPRELPTTPFEFTVKPGAHVRGISRQLADAGVMPQEHLLWLVARAWGRRGPIQAGTYRLEKPATPLEILDKMARGDVVLFDIVFVEGTTFRQWLAQLAAQPRVRQTLAGKADEEIRAALGLGDQRPEGLFFPDTYRFAPGTADVDILKRAHAAMKRRLDEAWAARQPGLPIANEYQALILASIVEKETGAAVERPLIASVFVNRLRRSMRLQTDPTVIYGMGERYDGNIRKRDLAADTPWNTYTRDGLPPTPIAMPGLASIQAATRPADTEYLYFVSRGDGTHEFTRNLEDHNRAVAKWQLKR